MIYEKGDKVWIMLWSAKVEKFNIYEVTISHIEAGRGSGYEIRGTICYIGDYPLDRSINYTFMPNEIMGYV